MTGVRRAAIPNADAAEALMRHAEEPGRTLPGNAVAMLREILAEAHEAFSLRSWLSRSRRQELAARIEIALPFVSRVPAPALASVPSSVPSSVSPSVPHATHAAPAPTGEGD